MRKKRIAELKQYQLRLLKNVKILIERVFTLEQVSEAHRFLQSADGFGKVVVVNE